MIGILTEKPSAARNFAKALGGMSGVYNGEQFVIVNALGHIYEYAKPDKQVRSELVEKYHSWDVKHLPWNEHDFNWKKELKPKTKEQAKKIKVTLTNCDEIVIATDVDPTGEGAVLGMEILDELKLIRGKKISRMYFVDESAKEVQKAFVNRKVISDPLRFPEYLKGLARAKYDYLTMQLTRIATHYSGVRGVSVRVGRLKSIMVQLVGEQYEAIRSYQKVPFYEWRFKDENGNVFQETNPTSVSNHAQLPVQYVDRCSNIIVDSRELKTAAPPKLLDLSSLSGILAERGFKPKLVGDTYQKMYENQIVSYPRTEDTVVSPEQFNELLPLVDDIAAVVGVDTRLLTHRQPRPTHVRVGGAHGANRPGPSVPESLDALRMEYGTVGAAIYELLAKNYLSILAPDYEYEQQRAHLELYPTFTCVANTPKRFGYKAIFNDEDDDEVVGSKSIGYTAKSFVHEGFPPKPAVPTVKWLMRQLDKHGIGTGATRNSTLVDVSSKEQALLKESRGKLTLTDLGERCFMVLPGTRIGDLVLTKQLFDSMKLVEKGQLTVEQVIAGVADLVRHDMVAMAKNAENIKQKLGVNETMAYEVKEKYEGNWQGRDVKFTRTWGSYRFTDEECERLCDGEKIEVSLVSKEGKPYKIEGQLEEQEYNGNKYVGFKNLGFVSNSSDGCPDSWCKHVFTQDEKTLLEAGKEVYIEGFVSKAGKTFNATLSYGVNPETGRKGIIPKFG